VFGRSSKRRTPSPEEIAAHMAWERETLDGFVASMTQAADGGPWAALANFLQAPTTRAALDALERDPELVSPRGEAAFDLLIGFARQAGCVGLLPALLKRQRWLRDLREAGWGARRAT
jgi:hypothetical protein